MRVKLSKKDYLWSYIGVIVSVCSYIAITPFALYFLSDDMYGLWGVFQSLVAITVLFDFGFSTTFARNINYCWSGAKELKREGVVYSDSPEPNYNLMMKTMEACRLVFLVISAIALVLMLTIGTVYISRVSSEIPGNESIIAWLIYVAAIFMNIYYGYFNSFLRGVGAIKQANQATVFARLSQIVLAVVFLFTGFGVIGTAIAYLSYGVIFRLLGRRYFLDFEGIGCALSKVNQKTSKSEIKEMFLIVWHNAAKEGIVTLANYLSNQACTIICSLYLSLTITGVYSLCVQVSTAVANVSAALYNANQPVLQAAYISNDTEKTKRTMSLIVVSYCLVYIFGILAVITIGFPVIKAIKPTIELTIPLMLGTGLYQFILKFRNCYTSYFSCTNRIPYVKAFLVSSALCIVFAIVATKYLRWGVAGLILGQLLSQLVYNAWAWTLKAHKELELTAKELVITGFNEMMSILKGFLHKEKRYA